MKAASIRPALTDSAIVGKSVKRWDSNRVDLLALVAKSVTGQVRWQVTGKKPTFSISRCSTPLEALCEVSLRRQGL